MLANSLFPAAISKAMDEINMFAMTLDFEEVAINQSAPAAHELNTKIKNNS